MRSIIIKIKVSRLSAIFSPINFQMNYAQHKGPRNTYTRYQRTTHLVLLKIQWYNLSLSKSKISVVGHCFPDLSQNRLRTASYQGKPTYENEIYCMFQEIAISRIVHCPKSDRLTTLMNRPHIQGNLNGLLYLIKMYNY